MSYADRVAAIMLEQGRARAQAQLGTAAAWGQATQQLGQIPGQIVQQQQQLQDAAQQRDVRAQQIATAKAAEQDRLDRIAKDQRAAKNQQTMNAVLGRAFIQDPETGFYTVDREIVAHGLQATPELIPQTMENLDKLETSLQKGAKFRNESVAQALHNIAQAGFTTEAALSNLAPLKKNHMIPEDRYQGMLDQIAQDGSPEGIQALVTRVGGALPEYGQLVNAEAERVAKLKKTEAETAALGKPIEHDPTKALVHPVTGAIIQPAVPKEVEHSPQYKEYLDYAADQRTQGKQPVTFTVYQDMDANRHRSVSITNAATDDAMIMAAAKNILANPRDLTSIRTITSLRGDQRLKLFNEIKRLNPDFNVGNIDRQIRFLDSYEDPKGRAAVNRGSMNNILQHAADLSSVNEQYRRSNLRLVNTPIAALQKQGGTEWQQFATPLAVLKDEIALYFAGGYAPSGDQQKTWDRIANDTATPAQIEQFAKDLIHVGLRRADTHNEQFKTVMGYDDPNLITPAAVAAGQRLGLGDAVKKYGSGGTIGAKPGPPAAPTPAPVAAPAGPAPAAAPAGTVKMQAPDGTFAFVLPTDVAAATAKGAKVVP